MLTITAAPRTGTKNDELRAAGSIPAVLYGPKEAALPITLTESAFTKVWKQAGESTIVSIEGVGPTKEVLIHDVQVHPLTGTPLHVDFYAFDKSKKLTATIPLHFVGVSQAEKSGAVIIKVMHELEIEVLPAELPPHIDVDLTLLSEIGKHITIADLTLPASAEVQKELTEIVALAEEAKEVVIETGAAEVAPAVLEAQAAAAEAAAAKTPDADKKKAE
jgi:large subunit ribosomal protein L25